MMLMGTRTEVFLGFNTLPCAYPIRVLSLFDGLIMHNGVPMASQHPALDSLVPGTAVVRKPPNPLHPRPSLNRGHDHETAKCTR